MGNNIRLNELKKVKDNTKKPKLIEIKKLHTLYIEALLYHRKITNKFNEVYKQANEALSLTKNALYVANTAKKQLQLPKSKNNTFKLTYNTTQ